MIDPEDVPHTYKYSEHKKILSTIHYWSNEHKHINGGTLVMTDFTYCYGNNTGNATAAGNYTQRNIDEDAMMIAEDILVRMDKNADGVITWPEVKGAVRADMKSMSQEMIRYYKDQFRAADVDGDKKVTMEELVNSIKQ